MSDPPPHLVLYAVLLLVLTSASILIGIAAFRSLAHRRQLMSRVAAFAPVDAPNRLGTGPEAPALVRGHAGGLIETFLNAHVDAEGRFRSWLLAAGIATSLSRFLFLAIAASGTAALGLHALGLSGIPLLIAWLLMLVGLPWAAIRALWRRRRARFRALLPDAIGLMVRGLRAGLPVLETVEGVAREFDEPLRGIFR
ncbi:MAG: type II secretion system F family protein, partial [Thermaurantiacus sp.]